MTMTTYQMKVKDGHVYVNVTLRDVLDRVDLSDSPILAEMKRLYDENAKLRELAFGMYGLLEMFDKMLGNHDACETPRPLVFGEDKSFKDVMRELGVEVD